MLTSLDGFPSCFALSCCITGFLIENASGSSQMCNVLGTAQGLRVQRLDSDLLGPGHGNSLTSWGTLNVLLTPDCRVPTLCLIQPRVQAGDSNGTYNAVVMKVKCINMSRCLVHNKCSTNVSCYCLIIIFKIESRTVAVSETINK